MPVMEYTGPDYVSRSLGRVKHGETYLVEDEALASHLLSRGDWERVEQADDNFDTDTAGDETPDSGESEASEEDGVGGVCGAEQTDGSICDRPVNECPYHSGVE